MQYPHALLYRFGWKVAGSSTNTNDVYRETGAEGYKRGACYQFERLGFYVLDADEKDQGRLSFLQTVSLYQNQEARDLKLKNKCN